MSITSRITGALIGAVAAAAVGSAGLAFAQEAEAPADSSTTTVQEAPESSTTAPAAEPEPTKEDCDERRGPAAGASSPDSATDTSV